MRCPWWASPLSPRVKQNEALMPEAPRFGSAVHRTYEIKLEGGEPSIAKVAEEFSVDKDRLNDYYRRGWEFIEKTLKERHLWGAKRLVEKKVAFDPFNNKARFLTSEKARDYSEITPREIPGTADLAVINGASAIVFDWKTGQKDYDLEDNAEKGVKANGQMLTLASALSVIPFNGNTRLFRRFIMRIDDEFIEPYEAATLQHDLDSHRAKLTAAMHDVLAPTPFMRPGDHCKWCNALEVCPSQAGAYGAPLTLRDFVEGNLDQDTMGAVYGRLIAGEALLRKVRDRVKDFVAANGAFEVDGGKVLRLAKKTRPNLSKASIRRALGEVQALDVIAQLENAGCIETIEYEELTTR